MLTRLERSKVWLTQKCPGNDSLDPGPINHWLLGKLHDNCQFTIHQPLATKFRECNYNYLQVEVTRINFPTDLGEILRQFSGLPNDARDSRRGKDAILPDDNFLDAVSGAHFDDDFSALSAEESPIATQCQSGPVQLFRFQSIQR